MSRYYDALKEASRSQPKPNEAPHDEGLLNGKTQSMIGVALPVAARTENGHGSVETAEEPSGPFDLPNLREEMPAKANGTAPKPRVDVPPSVAVGAVPVIPVIPVIPRQLQLKIDPAARLLMQSADPGVVEHYRRLRTKILQQRSITPFKTLIVASPNPQEGKTLTVLNLALSFAMLPDFKVLVIDGDLRRGTIGKLLGAEDAQGLSNVIEGSASVADTLFQSPELPVTFLFRGDSTLPAGELLHSRETTVATLRAVSEGFDLVLVDSAPVNLVTDSQLLAAACDAGLIVARAYSTTRKSLEQAVRDLQNVRLIGTVLNGGARAYLYRRRDKGYY